MTTYFISDLHLSEHEPHLYDCFVSFISNIEKDADALYILGDFFEYWIGDDGMSLFQQQVVAVLKKAANQYPVYIMHGNRDFLLSTAFYQASGCIAITDPYQIPNSNIILIHGDSLSEDFGYRCYRFLVRLSWLQTLFLQLPRFWRERIAKKLRGPHLPHHPDKAQDVSAPALKRFVNRYPKPIVLIHGHTHYPLAEKTERFERYVLAAWDEKGNTLVYDGKQFALQYFTAS